MQTNSTLENCAHLFELDSHDVTHPCLQTHVLVVVHARDYERKTSVRCWKLRNYGANYAEEPCLPLKLENLNKKALECCSSSSFKQKLKRPWEQKKIDVASVAPCTLLPG